MKVTQLFALAATLHAAAAVPVEKPATAGLRLLKLGSDEEPVWKTVAERLELVRSDTGFIDVTKTYERSKKLGPVAQKLAKADYPSPSHQSAVEPLLSKLSTFAQRADLTEYSTSFHNRYYEAKEGAEASEWIQSTVRAIASDAGRTDIKVTAFEHDFIQTSTIVEFAAEDASGEITILSGHMDSINQSDPETGLAPGADDDGSGTVNLIDIIRVLAQSGYKPATPLEFHFYGGEELGLLGSGDIATSYRSAGKSVKGVLQLDMTAFPGSSPSISLIDDNVDSALTAFVAELAGEYSSLPVTKSSCGYGCSDHASWTENGFPSAFPFEAAFDDSNPVIHTSGDTIDADGFSFEHMLEFSKLGLGFAIELSSA